MDNTPATGGATSAHPDSTPCGWCEKEHSPAFAQVSEAFAKREAGLGHA